MEMTSRSPLFRSSLEFKSIFRALGITSSTTLVAVFISVLTNKILSVVAGVDGVAMMGVYRNLAALVSGVIAFGYSTVIMQKVSVAKTKRDVTEVLSACFVLLGVQAIACVTIAFLFSGVLSRWLLAAFPGEYSLAVAVVVIMAFVNLGLQTLIAVFRGLSRLWALTVIQISTAVFSLLCIYPLVKWGSLGLAVNVASGSVFGLGIALYYLRLESNFAEIVRSWRRGQTLLKESAWPSFLVTMQTGVVLGGILWVQSLIGRFYGSSGLGNFNAAYLVMETGIMVLTSSAYSYFLPGFAKCESEEEKQGLLNRMLMIMLLLAGVGALALAFASELVIRLLFSAQFEWAPQLLAISAIGLMGLVFNWVYNTILLHKANYRDFFIIELLSSVSFVVFVAVAGRLQLPLFSIAWAYVASFSFKGVLYLGFAWKRYGRGYIHLPNLFLAIGMGVVLTMIQLGMNR